MRAILISLSLLTPALCAAKPALKVDPSYPTVGQPATVTLTGVAEAQKGLTIKVTYRPASQTAKTDDVGEPDARGAVKWTPRSPGVTRIAAVVTGKKKPVATVTVSTRFASAPITGILVMLIAGLVLFGCAGWSIRVAMRKGTDRPMPMDT
jgi:hypothetical protein